MLVGPCVVGILSHFLKRTTAAEWLHGGDAVIAGAVVALQVSSHSSLCIEAGSSSGQLADSLLGWHPLLQLAMFVVAEVSVTANAPSLKLSILSFTNCVCSQHGLPSKIAGDW
jgi:hypothetical protein